MQQLTSINWGKYQSKKLEVQNWHLDFLISPSFQGVNRLSVLSYENEDGRLRHTKYYLPKVGTMLKLMVKTFLINQ